MGSLGGLPNSGLQITAWGIAFLDWNAKWVVGYPGTRELFVALQRGEIDMTATSNLFLIQQLVEGGQFRILTQSGRPQDGKTVGRPEFGDAPLITTMVAKNFTKPIEQQALDYWASITALDKWVALPPNTPEPYVQAYRDAYKAVSADPEFAEMAKKISENFEPMTWEDANQLLQKLGATSPEALAFMSAMLKSQGLTSE
jgi:tripartite-type tricarboxylate transporter receptor subunit TctC